MSPEAATLRQARRGDLAAFNQLVLAHQDAVYRYVAWMLADTEAAARVTQQVFLQAYAGLHAFHQGDLACWLLRIASQLCQQEGRVPCQNLTRAPAGLETRLLEGLQALPAELRAVLSLVDLQGLDYGQAAGILGLSPQSVRANLAQARLQLHEQLGLKRIAPS